MEKISNIQIIHHQQKTAAKLLLCTPATSPTLLIHGEWVIHRLHTVWLGRQRSLELGAGSGPVIAVLLQCNLCNVHAQGFPMVLCALQGCVSERIEDMQRGGSPAVPLLVSLLYCIICWKTIVRQHTWQLAGNEMRATWEVFLEWGGTRTGLEDD